MNEEGAFIGTILDASRKAYAAGAILRLQEMSIQSSGFVDSWGFGALVDDAELRLEHLAEALAAGRPELFALDVEWMATTHEARDIPSAVLQAELKCLCDELQESLPEHATILVRGYLEPAIERLASPPQVPPSMLDSEGPHYQLAHSFLKALLQGRRSSAQRLILDALADGISFGELHHHVITKVQVEVGRMWQHGEVYIAEEHLGSRIVEDMLALLRMKATYEQREGRSVLIASVAGNLHDIGARVVSDHFEMCGWESFFLGANTPVPDLVRAAEDFKPDIVALSIGLTSNVRATSDTINALKASDPDLPVIVGGRPFAMVENLWEDVGADGCAGDAASAVVEALRLTSKK
jgi:MerR family transcriptional regulator, light-induced transcriptional regulator